MKEGNDINKEFYRLKPKGFITIANAFLMDRDLSLKSRGVLATILSLPDNWDFSINGTLKIIKDGSSALRSAINELKEKKYCAVKPRRENNRIVKWVYVFSGEKIKDEEAIFKELFGENLHKENLHEEKLLVENLQVGNQTQYNNEYKEKEKENKKDSVNENLKSLDFDSFYEFYPKKKSKQDAEKAWKKLSVKDKKEAIDKLPTYIADCVMSKREYKYPATYLNQRTWEDDFDKKEEPQTDDKWPQQKEWIDKTIPNLSSSLNKIKIRAMRIICEDTDVLSILLRKLNDDGYEGEIMTAFYKAMKEWYED